jgi:hypothetical protein
LPVTLPLALFASLLSAPSKRTPGEVAGYIRDFIEGTGSEWDWDDFISMPIADPLLEAIRLEARRIPLPVTQLGMMKLEDLFTRAEAIKLEWLGVKKSR